MADLVFRRPRYTGGPVDLVFGDTGGGTGGGDSTITGTITFPAMAVSGLVSYDNKNPRRVSTTATTGWQQATPTPKDTESGWGSTARRLDGVDVAWAKATVARLETDTAWGISGKVEHANRSGWGAGQPVQAQFDAVHQTATRLLQQCLSGWQVAVPVQITVGSDWQTGRPAMAQLVVDMADALRLQALGVMPWQVAVKADRVHLVPWQVARPVPPGKEVWPPPGPGEIVPRVPSTHLVFKCPPWMGGSVNLVFGRVCEPEEPPPPGLVVVPVRSVYMVINSANLRRVDNNQVLPTFGSTLTLDVDSWTWTVTADMPVEAQPLLNRTNPAEPVEVELTINGAPYRALVENVTRNRTWGNWRISVRCRGLASVLDEPYAPQQTFFSATARTAQQLMADALTINGESIGWNIDWGITDWLVSAGAWSHQGSMISAVNRIAQAAGAYVQPHATAKTLRVLPRYPSVPWSWGSVTPDFQLPADVVSVENVEWVDRAAYNRVFVSGTEWGVNGQVTRQGTAGDLVAPMVSDPLITHVDAARQRGIAELGRGGRWANMSLRIPVLDETGLILPGKFVRYVEGGEAAVGIVRSIQVADNGTEIWQTLGVESYVS